MTPNKSPEPYRRWRGQFRCRGSRRESAVAPLSRSLDHFMQERQQSEELKAGLFVIIPLPIIPLPFLVA